MFKCKTTAKHRQPAADSEDANVECPNSLAVFCLETFEQTHMMWFWASSDFLRQAMRFQSDESHGVHHSFTKQRGYRQFCLSHDATCNPSDLFVSHVRTLISLWSRYAVWGKMQDIKWKLRYAQDIGNMKVCLFRRVISKIYS